VAIARVREGDLHGKSSGMIPTSSPRATLPAGLNLGDERARSWHATDGGTISVPWSRVMTSTDEHAALASRSAIPTAINLDDRLPSRLRMFDPSVFELFVDPPVPRSLAVPPLSGYLLSLLSLVR